jgi:hypothetical protein
MQCHIASHYAYVLYDCLSHSDYSLDRPSVVIRQGTREDVPAAEMSRSVLGKEGSVVIDYV